MSFIPDSSLQPAPSSTPANAPTGGRAQWFTQASAGLGTLSQAFANIYGTIKGTNPQNVTINQPAANEGGNQSLMYVLIGLAVVVVLVLIYLATRKK